MTREQAKKLLPFIQAFVDGIAIQSRIHGGAWKDAISPVFSLKIEYRIKPEQKVKYFIYDSDLNFRETMYGVGAHVKVTFENGKLTEIKIIENK